MLLAQGGSSWDDDGLRGDEDCDGGGHESNDEDSRCHSVRLDVIEAGPLGFVLGLEDCNITAEFVLGLEDLS